MTKVNYTMIIFEALKKLRICTYIGIK